MASLLTPAPARTLLRLGHCRPNLLSCSAPVSRLARIGAPSPPSASSSSALIQPPRRSLCSSSVRWRPEASQSSRPPAAATATSAPTASSAAAGVNSTWPSTSSQSPSKASLPSRSTLTQGSTKGPLVGEPLAPTSAAAASAADPATALASGPAAELKQAFQENPYTWPNLLTLSRMLACPVLAYAIVHDQSALAGGLLVYAGVTDYVDGWMARHWNMGSVLGSMLDPLADKTLMATLVGALAYKALLPMPLAVVIIGRDVALALGAFYLRFRTLQPPRTFSRYWDISRPSISIHPTTFSKINTALQIVLMTALTISPLLPAAAAPWLEAGMWLVGATTAGSGLSYLWVKGAIRRVPMK